MNSTAADPAGRRQAVEWALRIAPIVVCFAVFWTGIRCWFFQDDFAWLGLGFEVHSFRDLLRTLFEPKAQGTIRPLSERVYFLGLFALFGLDALPFRIVAFLTQAVNLWLVGSVARRLTGSRIAAFVAPLLWGLNAALAVPLSWSAAYNQILCTACLLGAFLFFLKYVETGQRRYYFGQAAVFVAGFGALEMNVVYPALAAGYALLHNRRYLLSTLPLGAISLLYTLVHNYVAPKVQTGIYALHLDPASLAATFVTYWTNAFAWPRLPPLVAARWIHTLAAVAPWILTAALLGYLAVRLWRRDWRALFPYLWFVVVLGPVLPLRDHVSDYYLTGPTVGLAIAGSAAIAAAWRHNWTARAPALAVAALYLAGSVPVATSVLRFNYDRSKNVRDLVWSVEAIHAMHPGKVILLQGISHSAFWSGVYDDPFRLLGIQDVWLTPGSEDDLQDNPELGDVTDFVFPRIATLRALDQGKAVVYAAASYPLRNITSAYRTAAKSTWKPEFARRIDAGHVAFADQIGSGWYPADGGFRWMSRRAVVWLGPPRKPQPRLRIVGYCPASHVAGGALQFRVTANGHALPGLAIAAPDSQFVYEQPLPSNLASATRLEIVVEVDRTVRDGERDLGLAFGTFAAH